MARTWRQRVREHLDTHREELLVLVQALVRIPSVFGSEGACQAYVGEYLAPVADQVDIWEPDPSELERHPAYFARAWSMRSGVASRVDAKGRGRVKLKSPAAALTTRWHIW